MPRQTKKRSRDETDQSSDRAIDEARIAAVVDLLAPDGVGPLWGVATEDLNATLLAWGPGGGPERHVNDERDVVLVVLAGSAAVTIDDEREDVRAGAAVVIEKGRTRSMSAGPNGVRYLSLHLRRPPLQIVRRQL